MQKITPFLWFDKDAEEAINFYIDIFKNAPSGNFKDSEIVSITKYPSGYEEGPMANMEGKILTAVFKLGGSNFMALDGGPTFKHTPAISLYVDCEDQAEIDHFWDKMSTGSKYEMCGWLQDKYDVSWQIQPKNMADLVKPKKALDAMMKMKKINIAELEAAAKK